MFMYQNPNPKTAWFPRKLLDKKNKFKKLIIPFCSHSSFRADSKWGSSISSF